MSAPAASIIIPIYNTASYLRECLDSVVGQTLKDIEIILVNDASTDQSQQIIDEYASRDSRIRTINSTKNQGIGASRNKGIKIATGEYIGFVDSDDKVDKEMFFAMYQKALKEHADVVICGMENEVGKTITSPLPERPINSEKALIIFLRDGHLSLHCAAPRIQKRSEIIKNRIYFLESSFHEDFLHSFLVIFHASRIAFVDKPLYQYNTQSVGSITRYTSHKHLLGLAAGMQGIIKSFFDKKVPNTLWHMFYKYTWIESIHHHAARIVDSHIKIKRSTNRHRLLKQIYQLIVDTWPPFTSKEMGLIRSRKLLFTIFSNRLAFMFFYSVPMRIKLLLSDSHK